MSRRDVSAKGLTGLPVSDGSLVLRSSREILRRPLWRVLLSTNHKDIGTFYIILALLGGCVGGVLSVLTSQQLMASVHGAGNVLSQALAVHGLVMLFWFAMPALIGGMGNWFVPLMLGATDTAFPRLNSLGFWLLALGFVFILLGLLVHSPLAVNFSFASLYLTGLSALLGAINFIATILNMRAVGFGLHKMPLFCWSILVASFLLLLAVPVLAGTVTMLLLAPASMALFHIASDQLLFTRLFWFFGHPEAYIIILPAFGVVSQIISTFSGRPIKAYLAVAYAMVSIGLVGFVVWAHRLFFPVEMDHMFSSAALVLALPGAIPFVAWGMTLYKARLVWKTPLLWALGFMFLFIVGGGLGGMMSLNGTHNRYDLLVHLHYVLSMGAVFAVFGGFYYWIGKITGRSYPEFWGKLHFWSFFIGVNLTFLPMQFSFYNGWTFFSACGALLSSFSVLVFIYVLFRVMNAKRTLPENYWGDAAATLESRVSSPPPLNTFTDLPVIR